jgi:hypothetical protein
MRKHVFRPSFSDILEDRLTLSSAGAAGVVPAAVGSTKPTNPPAAAGSKPTNPPHPALRTGALNDVSQRIDVAFAQFDKAYSKVIVQLRGSGNEARFRGALADSAGKLKQSLDVLATLIPGGSEGLTPTLNTRVDNLLQHLSTNPAQSSTGVILSDQSGAHSDLASFVQGEIAKGVLSLR